MLVGVGWMDIQRIEAWTNYVTANYQTLDKNQNLGILQLCETGASRSVCSPMGRPFGYNFAENFAKLFNKLKDPIKKISGFPPYHSMQEVL